VRVAPAARAVDYDDDDEEERPSLLARMRERATGIRGLVVMVVVGVILSQIPRDMRLQDMTARVVALVGSWSTSAPSEDTGTKISADPAPSRPSIVAAQPPLPERIPPVTDASGARERIAPVPSARPEPRRVTAPAPPPPAVVAAVPDRAEPPPAPSEKQVAGPAAPAAPPTPPAGAGEEQFVPVVFTHKDYATVMQAMTQSRGTAGRPRQEGHLAPACLSAGRPTSARGEAL
jgi:hypothetical protein